MKARAAAARDEYDDYEDAPRSRSLFRRALAALLPRRVSDTVALAIVTAALGAVVVNAVGFQEPLASTLEVPAPRNGAPKTAPNPQPRPQNAPARTMNDLLQNIQKELSARGYYDGAIDGVQGPRTDQAIKNFQKGQGQNTLEPSDALLDKIRNTPVKNNDVTGSINTPPEGERRSLRVLALQRTLARLGYGPVRQSGTFSEDTKAAIERFERDWQLPVTGLMSDSVFAKLAAVNGARLA